MTFDDVVALVRRHSDLRIQSSGSRVDITSNHPSGGVNHAEHGQGTTLAEAIADLIRNERARLEREAQKARDRALQLEAVLNSLPSDSKVTP